MNLVPEVISRSVARQALLAQKASPEVLLVSGIFGMIGSTVLACRATLKMDETLHEAKHRLQKSKSLANPDSKEVSIIYIKNGVKVARLYAPAVIVGGLSIVALTSSHRILTRRNVALTAAYTALEKGFNEYRARVVEKYGEEQDRDFRYGTEQVDIIDPKTQKLTTVTRVSPEGASIYARFFDPMSPSWSKEPEYNLLFLKCQQNYANDLLRSRGHVFLNEVYDMLGIPRSKGGAVVGWVLSRNGDTDNFINFGVFEGDSDQARDFVNGREGSILLDFNVDGIIYDKIENIGEELSWQLGH